MEQNKEYLLLQTALLDPYKDRKLDVDQCPPLCNKPLQDDQLFTCDNQLPNIELLKDFLGREGKLTKQ